MMRSVEHAVLEHMSEMQHAMSSGHLPELTNLIISSLMSMTLQGESSDTVLHV